MDWTYPHIQRYTYIYIYHGKETDKHIYQQSDGPLMIDLRDKQTYFTAKWQTLYGKETNTYFAAKRQTHILLQKDTLCFFTARRQTKLFYYTNVMHAHILWQRDRQNYFTTQTQTHTFCGKETDKTILVFYYTDKHTHFAAKETKQFHHTDANTSLLQQRDGHTFLGWRALGSWGRWIKSRRTSAPHT